MKRGEGEFEHSFSTYEFLQVVSIIMIITIIIIRIINAKWELKLAAQNLSEPYPYSLSPTKHISGS